MKKIATLVLAAGLVLSAVTGAQAIDFKAKGQWIMSFDYGQGGAFNDDRGWGKGGEDEFEARQRVRLQLDAVASEALSGTVYFEIGDTIWGKADQGGALGADGKVVEVKRAYIDWAPPATDLKVRMGIQGIALPSFTTGSMVLNDDVAGITANYKFTDNVSLTALWARPYNDNGSYNTKGGTRRAGYMDNMDAFALILPITFDGIKVTPWGMYAAMGPGTFNGQNPDKFTRAGMFPAAWGPYGAHRDGLSVLANTPRSTSYSNAWWFGLTGDITIADPFRFAWDFTYGSVDNPDNGRLNRSGWLASALFEYKMDWAIPGIVAWYGSGDDSNPANGSERMPGFGYNNTNNFSNFAFDGDPYIARDGVMGNSMAGTWGVGLRLKDMSFVEDLKHTFRVNLMGGTNAPAMGRKLAQNSLIFANSGNYNDPILGVIAPYGMEPLYLTTEDTALEIGLTNTYQMYDNFLINLEANYMALWTETRYYNHARVGTRAGGHESDAWNVNLSFVYSF